MRKNGKCLTLLMAFVMLWCVLAPVSALANVQVRYVYTKNGGVLNLRKAPVTHADNKILGIPYGSEVLVESYVNNNTWAYVSYNNQTGYVMTRYLVKEKPTSTPKQSGEETSETKVSYSGFEDADYNVLVRASTPGGYVNLRWGPSKSVAVHSKIYDGAVLHVIAENEKWAQVENPSTGEVGFMMRAFLTEQE